MTFPDLALRLDRLEATSSRHRLVRNLADLYAACSADDIGPATYLVQGRLAPFFVPVEIGLGEKLVLAALARAYGAPADRLHDRYRRRGDLGLVAGELARGRPGEPLPVVLVHQRLMEIATVRGKGAVRRRLELLVDLLCRLDPTSVKHLVRIVLGRLRLGVGDATVLDGLSLARRGDGSLRPLLEAAYNRTSDLGLIARTLWTEGESGVEGLRIEVGRPLRCQLAERLPDPAAVIAKLGRVGVQPKYDGFRVQIHRDAEEVRIFSRNLEDLTPMFPELVAAAGELAAKRVILDGEAIGYNPASEEYLPFQMTARRRRKHGIEELAGELPLRAFVFDVMYRGRTDLTPLPYERRYRLLRQVVRGSEVLLPAPLTVTDSVEVLTRELLDNISRGLEGVVAKRLDSPYQAGARNFNWVKLKRSSSGQLTDTVDVVLLGYYHGRGKRAGLGAGALLAGVYDPDRDLFVTVTRIGTGLSDAGWREVHRRGDALRVDHRPARVDSLLVPDVWLQPALVAEVRADEITRSPVHTCGKVGDGPGFALRFPRIVSFRSADKRPEDATTVREIEEMYRQQRRRTSG
ncbi:MAG TPA: ATP-dependent DNA ligase [Candidatus Dormibacteraeota bacterium]|jgi:DNA ligase-1|nr:ATP-dependent DNA ligase [Candidatus Dormibacteraeota bacterium]